MLAKNKMVVLAGLVIPVLLMLSCNVDNYPTQSYKAPEISTIIKWKCDPVSSNKVSIYSVKEYSGDGILSKYTEFNDEGNTSSFATYSYNDLITNIQTEYYNATGNLDSVRNSMLQLDNSGNVIRKTVFDDLGNAMTVQKFAYDSHGNVVSKIVENGTGAVQSEVNYSYNYNANGDILSRLHNLQPDGSYQYKDSLIYHNDKQIVEKVSINSTGFIDSWYKYVYDLEGRIIQDILMNASGDITAYFRYEYKFY